ncbi:YncE family protein [Clostridium uliginosum]|uniref:DNA-binding beta-propeller fold protein YncE n=1 Tax=Clostridium uliginosum TaxID=119641 RepID=A0A1I1KCW5_9CLOT|nr:YncE family protein [Clostridium uliginosum]SFC55380.1 DNA-binding beta-propeller fold protein YncE [Clostridium uliginosum]
MKSIILCNTGSDTLNKMDVKTLNIKTLSLSLGESAFGPHGLSLYGEKLLVANNYNNTISSINIETFKEENSFYIGAHPNDLAVYNDKAYVLCGESNSLIIYDLLNRKVNFELPTGAFPHSIAIFNEGNNAFISNMCENSISVIDCIDNKEIKRIRCEEYPTKIIVSQNKKYLYVCESYVGHDVNGSISIISLENLTLQGKINVGISPVDLWEDSEYLYVSNLVEGCISIVNLNKLKEESKIFVGGMPRGIIKVDESVFVGDYLNGQLKVVNLKEKNIKTIAIGIEPNAMILIKDSH